jgi:hypothetical protein
MVSAELYKYYNQNGTLSFTDDISMVPADQRPAIETIPEVQSNQKIPGPPAADAVTKPISDQSIHGETGLNSELEMEFKQLGQDGKNLSDEYLRLKERQALLIENGKKQMNTNEVNAYNQEVTELNAETEKYKEKQDAYFKKVDAYNLKLKSTP